MTARAAFVVFAIYGSLFGLDSLGASIVVTGALTQEFEVTPGNAYPGVIDVFNPEETPQTVKIYQTDYSFSADGKVSYGEPGGAARSNAKWIVLSPDRMTVPVRKTASVRFTIEVPQNSTMRGTYWSVIMVEPVPTPGAGPSATDKPSLAIQQVFRFAVQIVTHVGATGSKSLKFNQIKVTHDQGKIFLVTDVENTGERWLRGNLWTEIYDAKGVLVGKFGGGQQRMYPGTSVRFTEELVGIGSSSYQALIVIDCGGDDVFGAHVNFVLH